MPTGQGRLIVMEGADGSGKTTLAHALVAHLEAVGLRAVYFSFPGREPGTLGAEVYDLHHRSRERGVAAIHPASMQLLHIAAHIDAIETRILPALREGTHIVLDRFWWSTWVYGVVAGASPSSLKAMIDVEHLHWGAVRPAMAFLVLRAKGRADDVAADRRKRIEEYGRLVAVERNDYPVRTISNEGTVPAALKKILAELRFLDWPSSLPSRAKGSMQGQLALAKSPVVVSGVQVFSRLAPAKTTAVYDAYWRFANERQRIFFARTEDKRWPWTNDPVLREYKFTNAYRASDRVSQYLIKEVIYRGDASPDEVFFRTLLFKTFNRIETWELLRREFGEITFAGYSFKRFDAVLSAAMERGERVYSAAYIMPSGGAKAPAGRKHSMHLRLIEQMVKDGLPKKIGNARSMAKAFELIRDYPTIGDFLAYQYVTDLNYGPLTAFSEMEFVVPGPGAFSGIHKCFSDLGGLTEAEIIKVVTERQDEEFQRLGLSFRTLWGRPLQLIDCQNLFCEVDKYARVMHPEFSGPSGRTRIKQRFTADPKPIQFWYPPKWGLNELITKGAAHV
ncbi:MAG TPA: nucleotide kinase domain-containing protein [Candidatus Didemnitutus sp.]|nr:nucleotide kinase domain-containing protein [Candidatus Didemnitutus sp.]